MLEKQLPIFWVFAVKVSVDYEPFRLPNLSLLINMIFLGMWLESPFLSRLNCRLENLKTKYLVLHYCNHIIEAVLPPFRWIVFVSECIYKLLLASLKGFSSPTWAPALNHFILASGSFFLQESRVWLFSNNVMREGHEEIWHQNWCDNTFFFGSSLAESLPRRVPCKACVYCSFSSGYEKCCLRWLMLTIELAESRLT